MEKINQLTRTDFDVQVKRIMTPAHYDHEIVSDFDVTVDGVSYTKLKGILYDSWAWLMNDNDIILMTYPTIQKLTDEQRAIILQNIGEHEEILYHDVCLSFGKPTLAFYVD